MQNSFSLQGGRTRNQIFKVGWAEEIRRGAGETIKPNCLAMGESGMQIDLQSVARRQR